MLGSGTRVPYTARRSGFHFAPGGRRSGRRLAIRPVYAQRVRTVYLGTSPFAVTVLERVAASEHRPLLVVTRPDRPRGRGRKVSPPAVAEAARELGIELLQPDSVNSDEARAAIAAVEPDAVLICASAALIREPLLSEQAMLNVHPSLLPR